MSARPVAAGLEALRLGGEAMTGKTSLYALIADYWNRYHALALAMDATDESDPRSTERYQADIVQREAAKRLDAAAVAVCEHVPTWIIDARIKHDFIASLAARNGELTKQETAALLASTLALFSSTGRAAA